MRKSFQDVLRDIENNLMGIELNSISGNATAFVISEVDYENSAVVLSVQGKRKTWTFDRLAKVWNEMYYRPAANVEIVFGGSGSSRNQVETIFASMAYVEWLYINSKKCIAYVGEATHQYGSLRHMETEKESYYQKLMNSPNPRNPLLEPDEIPDSSPESDDSEYQRAAKQLKDYILESGFDIPTSSDDIEHAMEEFRRLYAPDVLQNLDDSDLLTALFYSMGDNTNSLCYYLERNKECRELFGAIGVYSNYSFGLFQDKKTGIWKSGAPRKPEELEENEALVLGKKIRDALVTGVKIIESSELSSIESYEKLDADLMEALGKEFYTSGWVHKYFSIICFDKLSGFHSPEWQYHVLRALNIQPSSFYYGRTGQISMVQNHAGWYYRQFFDVFYEQFGEPRYFVRLGSTDGGKTNYAKEWSNKGVVGIGWAGIGDLSDYLTSGGINKSELQDKLRDLYFVNDDRTASRKAGEISRFYSCGDNTVFVVMDGERLIALADKVGAYYFDSSSSMAHRHSATWKYVFEPDSRLPDKTEGLMTTCVQIKSDSNLLYLYDKYYHGSETDASTILSSIDSNDDEVEEDIKIQYHTGYLSPYERNRILFGAPGTGKSFTLKTEATELLGAGNEEDYERVTFHPDYSYANFVGTYKPVPHRTESGEDTITYAYVPGPFMRVYVNALKNSQTDTIKPFLLIIEEINRANVAAVFGDVFQLLDRGDDNVSEYPIQASEDIKAYLAKELGGQPDDYSKIRIPDNMFIWATMNSADQGVYPVDTAFKRRWDFTYLGIDDSEAGIKGKTVILGRGQYARVVEWNKLRKAINTELLTYKVNEDKLLGPYFIAKKNLSDGDTIDPVLFSRIFKNKVIMYLFEDAGKQRRPALFGGCEEASKNQYSKICSEFDEKGVFIFCEAISREFIEKPSEDVEQ